MSVISVCDATGGDDVGRTEFMQAIIKDDVTTHEHETTHEQWLDMVHVCQVYNYHDCAMDILTCVTELFANERTSTGNDSSRRLVLPDIDERRHQSLSMSTEDRLVLDSSSPRRQNTQRPPVKPASLPSLQLSDSGRRQTNKRHNRWANSIILLGQVLA